MSFNRYARRADKTTQQIVDELRALGYTVEYVGKPVDLLVSHASWPLNTWKLIECKSPEGKKGQVWHRTKMQKQQDFCAQHGVHYALDGLSAVRYLQANSP